MRKLNWMIFGLTVVIAGLWLAIAGRHVMAQHTGQQFGGLTGWGSPIERAAQYFPAIHSRFWSTPPLPSFLCPTTPQEAPPTLPEPTPASPEPASPES